MIHFEEIDPGNWRLGLNVSNSQKAFVSDSFDMLARAYAYRNFRSCAFVIYHEETPVGMAMFYDCEELNAYVLSQLFIDERYQGRGYGKEATQLILDMMKQDGKYDKVILCYIDGNSRAKELYESFGFRVTDRDEDEIVMEKLL